MIDALRDTSLPTKLLVGVGGIALAAGLWSSVSSTVLLAYLQVPIKGIPLGEWWQYLEHYPRPGASAAVNAIVSRGIKISAAVSTAVPVVIGLAYLARPRIKPAHDDARWATWRDIRRAGFSARSGTYLGRVGRRWLRSGEGRKRRNTAIIAPTQSGKGVGFVLPAGLCDPTERTSFAFFDPKFQAFTHTSGWQMLIGANVILFAPLSETGQTAQYNPCAYVRRNPDGSPTVDTWGDIEAIVFRQIATSDEKSVFWTDSARIAYTAMLGFLSETDGVEFHIPAALDLMFRPDSTAYINRCIEQRRNAGRPYSSPVATNLREFLHGNDEVRDSIRKTIKSKLGIFFNPRVRAATSGNTFDLTRILHERTALYVGVNFGDIARLQPLTALLFQQMIGLNTRGLPGADEKATFDLLFVADEFANMGAMPDIVDAFSFCLEYGIRINPVIQTPAQLEGVYGKAGTKRILDNCKDKVVLGGIDDMDFCRDISARLGTIKGERRSVSGNIFTRRNTSVSEAERPLLSPYEVSQLADDNAIILHGGIAGILAKRIRYYEMAPFKHRLSVAPTVPAIKVELEFDQVQEPPPVPSRPPAKPATAKSATVKPVKPASVKPASPKPLLAIKKPVRVKAAPRRSRADPGGTMSLARAEATLRAVMPGVDLTQFAQSPAAAKAQIDRVIHQLPTPKKGRT